MTAAKKSNRVHSDKPVIPPITDWNEADDNIQHIGRHQKTIEAIKANAQVEIDKIKADAKKEVELLTAAIKLQTQSLKTFATGHRKEFGTTKSKKLNFGTIGWRYSTSISINKKNTLELIKQAFRGAKRKACIITSEKVDKNALAKLKDEQLAEINARRKSKDEFFVEPATTEIVTEK